jgi:tight adherence protein B
VVAGAVGLLLGGVLPALLLAAAVPVITRVWIGIRIGARQAKFADQLEDSLQLLSSSLRAGHSMLQALNSVAREAEQPTSEEFTRIINQTRVGREVGDALADTAARMQSDDFSWVTQAIAINREVGGNLAEVLDAVGSTIRERNQIRRQVKALAAEGKMSAYVLMALPFGITIFLAVANPSYLATFTTSLLGYALIGVSVVMLVIGALWLRKVINIKF